MYFIEIYCKIYRKACGGVSKTNAEICEHKCKIACGGIGMNSSDLDGIRDLYGGCQIYSSNNGLWVLSDGESHETR